MNVHSAAEPVLTAASLLILIVYHAHLVLQSRRKPGSTSFGLTNQLRHSWVNMIMSERRDILAVQTLRNWIMAASFFASTSILIALGTLNLLFRGETVPEFLHAVNLAGSRSHILWLVKVIILIIDFFCAFFNFALTIRYYNHVNFMINVSPDQDRSITVESVTRALNLGTTHYTLGMRSYYLAVPLSLWLFGPLWMFGGTVMMILILYRLDRTA